MARISKDPAERREEILQSAKKLFRQHGYEKTVVSDIVKDVKIAQGTFYNYFTSKEDIFMAILEIIQEDIIKNLEGITLKTNINAAEKFNLLTNEEFNLNRESDDLYLTLHNKGNEGIHQKYIVNSIKKLIPIYSNIIKQGVQEGIFNTNYPEEAAEYILFATKFMFDPGINQQEMNKLSKKFEAACDFIEKILGAKKGTINAPKINV
jgi:AcrR family transcriptional regulator